MKAKDFEFDLEGVTEQLAALEHERWSYWQRYLHGKGARQADGSLLLPAELVERWERQIATPYEQLSDIEKESDREQVRRYLPLILKAIKSRTGSK